MTLSNENSSTVRENFPIELFSLASGPTDKVLNSVEVYEHENYNRNQKREDEINHTTMELQYTFRRVVEVIASARILDKLMRQILTSNG